MPQRSNLELERKYSFLMVIIRFINQFEYVAVLPNAFINNHFNKK